MGQRRFEDGLLKMAVQWSMLYLFIYLFGYLFIYLFIYLFEIRKIWFSTR